MVLPACLSSPTTARALQLQKATKTLRKQTSWPYVRSHWSSHRRRTMRDVVVKTIKVCAANRWILAPDSASSYRRHSTVPFWHCPFLAHGSYRWPWHFGRCSEMQNFTETLRSEMRELEPVEQASSRCESKNSANHRSVEGAWQVSAIIAPPAGGTALALAFGVAEGWKDGRLALTPSYYGSHLRSPAHGSWLPPILLCPAAYFLLRILYHT